jgi:hypothetical protein
MHLIPILAGTAIYDGISKSFQTESIKKSNLTTINTH